MHIAYFPLVFTLSLVSISQAHSHEARESLPGSWYHARDHPVNSLFGRAKDDGRPYPAVGTPEWKAQFPVPGPAASTPEYTKTPIAWLAAYHAAVAGGKIPKIPPSTSLKPNTNPVYPQGSNPLSPDVCSATYKCKIPGDIWDAPEGIFASSFDDGPQPLTPFLVDFLKQRNLKTTHFMIGVDMIFFPTQFLSAFEAGHDIAVHTWSHPYMTTLNDVDVVAQLGWTMELIHSSTGGRVPRYWRPPYGDTDLRVSAIAKEVFGLETVIWNYDTFDWGANATKPIVDSMTGFLAQPKKPGLIILEHEVSNITISAFIESFPMIAAQNWTFKSLAEAVGDGRIYQNAASSTSDDVLPLNIVHDVAASFSTIAQTSSVTTTSSLPTTTPQQTATAAGGTQPSSTTSDPASPSKTSASSRLSLSLLSLFLAALSTVLAMTS